VYFPTPEARDRWDHESIRLLHEDPLYRHEAVEEAAVFVERKATEGV
jgi:hypothetical protein